MDAADLGRIRDWVGGEPDDTTLDGFMTELRSWPQVAMRVLMRRLADFQRRPASLGADGLSQGTAANITSLEKRIDRLQLLVDVTGSDPDGDGQPEFASVGRMVRPDRYR